MIPTPLPCVSSAGDSIGSTRSSVLTAPGSTPFYDIRHHHDNNLSASLDPLDILTGEGHPGAAPERLSYEASGGSNLIAAAMDRVGDFDPGEVRRWSSLPNFPNYPVAQYSGSWSMLNYVDPNWRNAGMEGPFQVLHLVFLYRISCENAGC